MTVVMNGRCVMVVCDVSVGSVYPVAMRWFKSRAMMPRVVTMVYDVPMRDRV